MRRWAAGCTRLCGGLDTGKLKAVLSEHVAVVLMLVAYAGEYRGVRALAPPAPHPRPPAPLVPPGRMCESWRRARAAGRGVYPLTL